MIHGPLYILQSCLSLKLHVRCHEQHRLRVALPLSGAGMLLLPTTTNVLFVSLIKRKDGDPCRKDQLWANRGEFSPPVSY